MIFNLTLIILKCFHKLYINTIKISQILDEYLNGPSTKNIPYNHSRDSTLSDTLDLGPLPPKWEKAYTKNGEVYFIE